MSTRRRLLGLCSCLLWSGLAAAQAGQSLASGSEFWRLPGNFVDEAGRPRQLSQLAGRPTVVAMEYTACRFVCSVYWRRLVEIQAEADRRGLTLEFLILSLDPTQDSPELWREYRKMRGLNRANWHFLTGDRAATDRVIRWLGVHWWLYEGAIMHDFRVTRLNAQGQRVALMDGFEQPAAAFLATP